MYNFKDGLPTKEELESLKIFQLRDVARMIGVERPVIKSRKQIIEEILKIIQWK